MNLNGHNPLIVYGLWNRNFALFVGPESESNEVFILQSCSSIHLCVSRPEGVSQSLNLHTAYDEVVQSHLPPFWIVPTNEVLGECWCEPVCFNIVMKI